MSIPLRLDLPHHSCKTCLSMALELECNECSATNRVPQERLADTPKCGRCGRALELPLSPEELHEVEDLFQQVFSQAPPCNAVPPSAPDTGPAIVAALRQVTFGQARDSIADRRRRIVVGLWGVVLGVPITVAGTVLGTLLMNTLLAALGVRGSVVMPQVVLAAAYAGSIYGFLVMLTGTERLVGGLLPAADAPSGPARWLRLLALVVVGFALLIGVWGIVHAYGLADFSL